MAALVASDLLYPDSFTYSGIRFAGIRVSPSKVIFVMTAPVILWYSWKNLKQLAFRPLDAALLATMTFVLIRGTIGAESLTVGGLNLTFVAYALTFYYGAAYLGQRETARRLMIWVLMSLGLVIAVYAIAEFFIGENIYQSLIEKGDLRGHSHRSMSTIGNPLVLGLFLSQITPLYAYKFFLAKQAVEKAFWLIAVAIMAVAVVTTQSKGAWITAIILGLAGTVWVIRRYPEARKQAAIMFGCVVLIVAVFSAFNYDTLKQQAVSPERQQVSISPRLYMIERFPEAFWESPWIGYGMREGPEAVAAIDPVDDPKVINPHSLDNIYLTNLVDEGLIGVTLIVITSVLLALQPVYLIRKAGPFAGLAAVLAFSQIALLIDGFTFDTILYRANMILFWLFAGLTRAMFERQKLKEGQVDSQS